MELFLHCHERVDQGAGKGLSRLIDVVDRSGNPVETFEMMCAAIDSDVRSSVILDWIRKVESGEEEYVEVDGNGWVITLSRNDVSFEGLYGQGEGGNVSFEQFCFAVKTFLLFLANSSSDPIKVPLMD
ncbi:MAG: hypothetical protein EON58_09895 [Alphaproteobacteria bacterium]|nr:MAG: hypothetical protein EON58_09895 [Alphaproteobacteria bacterium]